MKKGMILGGVALLMCAGGLWWLAKRPQRLAGIAGEEVPLFSVKAQGAGTLIGLNPPGPLRTVAWLPPLSGERALCFVSSQADQRWLGLFRGGAPQRTFQLPLPEGVEASFFRKATLRDAAFTARSLIVLLGDDDRPKESALLLCLDETTGDPRWSCKVPAQRLAVDGETAILYGRDVPMARLTLSAKKPQAVPIELPPEVKAPEAVLPLGPKRFLVAHAAGLSACLDEGEWKHTPMPSPNALAFPEFQSRLVRAGKTLWWQPRPGQLMEVDGEAAVLRELKLPELEGLPRERALDRELLALKGADADGQLWFDLATPKLPGPEDPKPPQPPLPPPEGVPGEAAPPVETAPAPPAFTPEARQAWEAHLAQPMDRLYRLSKDAKILAGFAWGERWVKLQPPADVPRPQGFGTLAPEGGAFLLGDDLRRWWLPLKAFAQEAPQPGIRPGAKKIAHRLE